MSLPPEHKTNEMEALNTRIANATPEELSGYPPLTQQDVLMIGNYIHHFNFIDFNLRRSLEVFIEAELLVSKKYVPDSELTKEIINGVNRMNGEIENIAETTQSLNVIEYGRKFRNLMAHFAAKRIPNVNSIVFVSKDDRDAQRVLGKSLGFGRSVSAVAPIDALENLTREMAQKSSWLAVKMSEWYSRYEK